MTAAGLKPITRIYLFALTSVALALVLASAIAATRQSNRDLLLALLFAGCMTLAWRFPLHFAYKTKVYLDSAVIVASSLLFQPAIAMTITASGAFVAHGLRRNGRDWTQALFNTTQATILTAVGALFLAAAGWDPARPTFGDPLPLLLFPIVGLTMYGISILAVATVVALESGQALVASWKQAFLTDSRVEILTQLSLLGIGVLAAIVVDAEPWGLALLVAPIVTVYGILRQQSQLRQTAEQARQASEESLAATQRAARIGSWTMDLQSRSQQWSEGARRVLGLSAASNPTLDEFLARIDPADRAVVHDAIRDADAAAGPLDVEFRIPLPDGTNRVVHQEAVVELDPTGRARRLTGTLQDVTARRKLEAQVADFSERERVARELARTRRRLAESKEDERLRLARALHDGPVQDLLAISYALAAVKPVPDGRSSGDDPAASVDSIRHELLDVVGQLRGMIGELRRAGLDEFGLSTALEGYVSGLARRTGAGTPPVELRIDPKVDSLPHPTALTVFRIAQEALLNAVRHAAAASVAVSIERSERGVEIAITDDGRGFDVPNRLSTFAETGHFGIVGMVERAEQTGGTLTVTSAPGAGTSIRAWVPFPLMGGFDG